MKAILVSIPRSTSSGRPCPTCSGLKLLGPPPTICESCHGSGVDAPTTPEEGRRDLWRELTRWQEYDLLTPAQAARMAEVASVLVEGCTIRGDGRVAALAGVRAYLDAGLVETAREFFDKHNHLLNDGDRLTLRIEFRRVSGKVLKLEGPWAIQR